MNIRWQILIQSSAPVNDHHVALYCTSVIGETCINRNPVCVTRGWSVHLGFTHILRYEARIMTLLSEPRKCAAFSVQGRNVLWRVYEERPSPKKDAQDAGPIQYESNEPRHLDTLMILGRTQPPLAYLFRSFHSTQLRHTSFDKHVPRGI